MMRRFAQEVVLILERSPVPAAAFMHARGGVATMSDDERNRKGNDAMAADSELYKKGKRSAED